MKTPDEVCIKFSKRDIKLNIYKSSDHIVLEGDEETLKFLGNLILSQAGFQDDENFSLAPDGAGNKFFKKNSKLGLHISRKNED